MKTVVRAFIGISKDAYTLIIHQNNKSKRYNSCVPIREGDRVVVLTAILDCISKVPANTELTFYANDDLISFEWEKEYKVDGEFSKKTQNISLWLEIADLCKKKKISLNIKGEDSILAAFSKFK